MISQPIISTFLSLSLPLPEPHKASYYIFTMDTGALHYIHLRETYIKATRHRLYSGVGIGTASIIGCIVAVFLELMFAMILFGLVIPILAYQVWREYHRLRYLKRRISRKQVNVRSIH